MIAPAVGAAPGTRHRWTDFLPAADLPLAPATLWGSSTRQQTGQHADLFLIGCPGPVLFHPSPGSIRRLGPASLPPLLPGLRSGMDTPPSSPALAAGMGGLAGYLWVLLPLLGGRLVAGEDMISEVAFVQWSLTSEEGSSQYSYNINSDEQFHVDQEHKDIVWRLPRFKDLATYSAESILSDFTTLWDALDTCMNDSNNTPVENVPPMVTLYPEMPAELGEPNMLICLADGFLPPVINLTWLKNGQEVEATEETDFYPNPDHSFRKFTYLTFVPNAEDVYYCRVEHWGLAQPLTKEWDLDMAETFPETAESVVYGLGLAVGVVGIIVGTVFFIKGWRNNEANVHQRPV